jgi:predicted dehydrogenase
MMSEQIRVGVISTSWWSDFLILPSLSSHPQAQIAAICGRNGTRAEEIATKYNIPKIFTDYHEMIEKSELHAIVIASPDDLHYPMTMAALEAGLHVLCEKPLANNAQNAKAMYEKAQASDVIHMVLFTWRWMPHFQYLRKLIQDGYIGRLYHADFRFIMGYGRSTDYAWRFDKRRANGIVGDLGSHMIDMARWLVGDIKNVQANLAAFVEHSSPDDQPLTPANDSALLTVEFTAGGHSTIQASAVAHLGSQFGQQQVRLFGDGGTLQANMLFSGSDLDTIIQGAKSSEEQFQHMAIPPEYWVGLDAPVFDVDRIQQLFCTQSAGPRLFIDAILEDKELTPNFFDGLKVQEVIDAALTSHQTKRQVEISQ